MSNLNTYVTAEAVAAGTDYPVLKRGKETGMIVLFTAPKTGMILHGEDPNPIRSHQKPGYTSVRWANEDTNWTVFTGEVHLSNG